jgi:hypothetical protein
MTAMMVHERQKRHEHTTPRSIIARDHPRQEQLTGSEKEGYSDDMDNLEDDYTFPPT